MGLLGLLGDDKKWLLIVRARRKQKSLLFSQKAFYLAGAEGLEPPTPGFGDRCSTN